MFRTFNVEIVQSQRSSFSLNAMIGSKSNAFQVISILWMFTVPRSHRDRTSLSFFLLCYVDLPILGPQLERVLLLLIAEHIMCVCVCVRNAYLVPIVKVLHCSAYIFHWLSCFRITIIIIKQQSMALTAWRVYI